MKSRIDIKKFLQLEGMQSTYPVRCQGQANIPKLLLAIEPSYVSSNLDTDQWVRYSRAANSKSRTREMRESDIILYLTTSVPNRRVHQNKMLITYFLW